MNENYQTFYWCKLDNVAKLYAMVSSSRATNVFRLSVKLKDLVEKQGLENAVVAALEDMPSFKVRLRRGFFWYYFDSNFQRPMVREEYTYPCSKMGKFSHNGYLFNVTYFEKMLHLEVFHALADGAGAMQFLALILKHYIRHQEGIEVIVDDNEASQQAKDEDSFLKVEGKNAKNMVPKTKKAYKIVGIKKRPQELKVIHGSLPTKKVIQLAKKHQVSVTCFLTSVLIMAIYQQNFKVKHSQDPITVTVPINLRARFDSKTLRNFFANATIKIIPTLNLTFEEVLKEVSEQLRASQDPVAVEAQIQEYVAIQNRLAIRFVPLMVKNLVMKHIYFQADKGVTTTVSNLGRVDFSPILNDYIEEARVMIPVTPHQPLRCGIMSYGDHFVISFTSALEEADIQKYFFRFLRKQEIEVTISCNEEISYEILS